MFFKSKKIDIYSNKIPIHLIKEYFKIYPKNTPDFFKNIPYTLSHFTRKDHTLKSCSGIINFYKSSLVFNSPADIEIVQRGNEVKLNLGQGFLNDGSWFKPQNGEQFLDHVDNKNYEGIVKIMLQVYIKCDYPLLLTSSWWNMNDLEIIPGVILPKNPTELNFFIALKKGFKDIFISQNQPLFCLFPLTEKNLKINFNEDKINVLDYNGFNYVFNTLKLNKIKNKFYV